MAPLFFYWLSNTSSFSIWEARVILWSHQPFLTGWGDGASRAQGRDWLEFTSGPSPWGWVTRILPSHMSHAFQDIKCHINKASPLLSICVVTCQKVMFTWCGDRLPHLPAVFQVLKFWFWTAVELQYLKPRKNIGGRMWSYWVITSWIQLAHLGLVWIGKGLGSTFPC